MSNNNITFKTMNQITKTKVEKLLSADIQSAKNTYIFNRDEQLKDLKTKIIKNPTSEIKALEKKYFQASEIMDETKKKLSNMGFDISLSGSYPSYDKGLQLKYSLQDIKNPTKEVKQIITFGEVTQENTNKLDSLMRGYMIKIYANSAEMETLFEQMNNDIKKILG